MGFFTPFATDANGYPEVPAELYGTVVEGDRGTAKLRMAVRLANASAGTVTVGFRTVHPVGATLADGSATATIVDDD